MIRFSANANEGKLGTRGRATGAAQALQPVKAGNIGSLRTVLLNRDNAAMALRTEETEAVKSAPQGNDGSVGEWNWIGQALKLALEPFRMPREERACIFKAPPVRQGQDRGTFGMADLE